MSYFILWIIIGSFFLWIFSIPVNRENIFLKFENVLFNRGCLFTVLFFSVVTTTFSQYTYPKKEYAKKVLNSTLVVQLLEGKSHAIKVLNNQIKEVFSNDWKDTEVLFLTLLEIDSLRTIHKNGYSFIYQKGSEFGERRFREDNLGVSRTYQTFSFSYYQCYLNILIDGENHYVTSVDFGDGYLNKPDLIFMCQQMSLLINSAASGKSSKQYYSVNDHMDILEASTLILPTFFFKEKHRERIPKYYKYSYELVDAAEYDKIITNKEEGKAYVKIVWSNQHKLYMWIVVNAVNGEILAITGFGGTQFGNAHQANTLIQVKHLKYVTSKFAQKFNNRYGWKL